MQESRKPHGNTGNKHARGHGRPRVADPAKPRSIRVSDARWAEIRRLADESGQSITDWLIAGRA